MFQVQNVAVEYSGQTEDTVIIERGDKFVKTSIKTSVCASDREYICYALCNNGNIFKILEEKQRHVQYYEVPCYVVAMLRVYIADGSPSHECIFGRCTPDFVARALDDARA